MKATRSLIALTVMLVTGCVDPMAMNAANMANSDMAKKGSPYRWSAAPVDGGTVLTKSTLGTIAQTQADEALQADIVTSIKQLETQAGRPGDLQIKEVRYWDKRSSVIREIWVITAGDKSFAYVVSLKPEKTGGTTIHLTGPW